MFSDHGNAGESLRKHGLGVGKKLTNKSFQRFFDGWVEYTDEDMHGKEHRKMLYVADYHVCDVDMKKRILVRILYAALNMAAIALYVFSAVRRTAFNLTWYVGVPIAVTCVGVTWMTVVLLFYYIPSISRMTNFTFHNAVENLRKASRFCVYALGACAVMTLFSLFFHQDDLISTFRCALQYVFAASLIFMIYRIESRMGYHCEPSGNKAPVGSVYVATMQEVLPPKADNAEEKRMFI